ncbi:MAG: hypothetical protein K0S73_2858 [Stenotrophomonas rhizophila]|nr:hypothetical protein [Stenotrophomonas rhizophila]
MNELPAGWTNSQLGDLLEHIQAGKSVRCVESPPEEGQPGLVKISAVTWGKFNELESKTLLTDEGIDPRNKIHAGDLLISRANTLELVGAPVIVHAISKNLYLSDKVLRLDVPENIKSWVLLCLKSTMSRRQIESLATGNQLSMRNISQDSLRLIEMPLPPAEEQGRIVHKLDALLGQVETLKARIDAIPTLLKRFRESVLRHAASGRLTKDWRDANPALTSKNMLSGSTPLPLPPRYKSRSDAYIEGVCATSIGKPRSKLVDAWDWIPLIHVARMESGHTPSREVSGYWGGDIPWIGIKDARAAHGREIFATHQHTNKLGLENSAARLLPSGTVCVSRTASIGYVVKMGKPMATSQDFVNWVPSPYVNADWLKWLFVAEKESLFRFGKGSTHTTIYFPEWLSLHVALPHVEEQTVIAERVQSLLDLADSLADRVAAAKQRIDTLTQSLLEQAFRGELVPQDPNDEPASLLLDRIRAERAAAFEPKRRRKATTN